MNRKHRVQIIETLFVTVLSCAILFGSPLLLCAQEPAQTPAPTPTELRLKALEERLQAIEKAKGLAPSVPSPATGSLEDRLAAIEKRMGDLEQKVAPAETTLVAAAPAPAPKVEKKATVEAGKDGFWIKSADGDCKLKVGGYMQLDTRVMSGDPDETFANTFTVRRARPIISGTVGKYMNFTFMPEFGAGKTLLMDGYMDWKVAGEKFVVRAGKFKPPTGYELATSDQYLVFAERGLPVNLVPIRDVGVMGYGNLAGGIFGYHLGIFNGIEDGGNGDLDTNDDKDFMGRLTLNPFKNSDSPGLKGLGIAAAFTQGYKKGKPGSPVVAQYKGPSFLSFFSYFSDGKTYKNTVVADGTHRRFDPQAWYYYKGFGLVAEYARSSQEIRLKDKRADLTHTAWQAYASYCFGADATNKGVSPRRPFDPKKGQWGAFEVAARYNTLRVDPDAFPVFADPCKSAQRATGWTLYANWYLNANFRLEINYDHLAFDGGAKVGNRRTENLWITRFQILF